MIMMLIHLSFRMEREVGRNHELFIGHVRERKTDFNFLRVWFLFFLVFALLFICVFSVPL